MSTAPEDHDTVGAEGTVREPFFEPPRGMDDLDPKVHMGDGGVREPFLEPPRPGDPDGSAA